MCAAAFLHGILLGMIVFRLVRRCKKKMDTAKPPACTIAPEIELPAVPVVSPIDDAEPAAEATAPAQPDDLQVIEGIGPKISTILREAGVITFAQLASTDVGRLREILQATGIRLNDPTAWPEQAALAAEGRWDDLNTLKASLKAGRKVT